ncbi:extracellular solute-binding protein [Domibacillus tundrae]|uniref:extracellular solute-binding protein n=1 Tax=Domibacillus tundrae TaxID=1587527 RepID=UPI00339796B5
MIRLFKSKLFLLLTLLIMIVAGCGAPNATPDKGSSDGGGDGENVELTMWHIESSDLAIKVLEDAASRFEEKNPGVTVKVVKQENDPYKSKLVVAMGGANPPDVFHSWGGGWLKNFVDAGQVKEITSDVDTDSYLEAALSAATYDDKVYGAPLSMDVVPVWYNKEIFKKYNLEEPKTYEELVEVVKTLKENDVVPFSLANQSKWPGSFYLMYLAERIGGPELFNEAFERTGRTFDDTAYVEAGKKLQELVELGAFPEGVNGMNYDTGQSRQMLYTGKAAMEVMGSWLIGSVRNELPEFEEKLGYFLFPSIEGGQGAGTDLVGGVSPVFSVSEQSKHQDLAAALVKELTSKETAEQMANTEGSIAAVKDVNYEDEFVKEMSGLLEQAEYMQTYYDQTLPPELAEVHLDTTQGIFGGTTEPEEAMKAVEEKAKEVLK